MAYCEIAPELIQIFDHRGRVLAAWSDPTVFTVLVWTGCPLFHDPTCSTGTVLIDIDLENMTVLQANVDDSRAVHVPLTGPPRDFVLSWLRHRVYERD